MGRIVSAGRVPGRNRINTGRDHEIRYWTARLGCSAEELTTAIRVVGNSIASVREYLSCRSTRRQLSLHLQNALES